MSSNENTFLPPSWHKLCAAAQIGYWNTKAVADKVARHWSPEMWDTLTREERESTEHNALVTHNLRKQFNDAKTAFLAVLTCAKARKYVQKLGFFESIADNRVRYSSLNEVRRELDALLYDERHEAYKTQRAAEEKQFINEGMTFLLSIGVTDFTIDDIQRKTQILIEDAARNKVDGNMYTDFSKYPSLWTAFMEAEAVVWTERQEAEED